MDTRLNGVNVKYFLKSRIKPIHTIHVTIKQFFRGFYRKRKLPNLIKTTVSAQAISTKNQTNTQGGHSIFKNTGGRLDNLGSEILVGKIYFGVFQKY